MPSRSKRKARRSAQAAASQQAVEVPAGFSRSADRNFDPDYSYVIKDLKRIGLLAGLFFAVLLTLSFIL